jgi:hypothetical protein
LLFGSSVRPAPAHQFRLPTPRIEKDKNANPMPQVLSTAELMSAAADKLHVHLAQLTGEFHLGSSVSTASEGLFSLRP